MLTRTQRRAVEALYDTYAFNPDEDDSWVIATTAAHLGIGVPAVRYHMRLLKDRLDRTPLNEHDDSGQVSANRNRTSVAETFGQIDATIAGDSADGNAGYSVTRGSRRVGKGARKAGQIVKMANVQRIAIADLPAFVEEHGGDLVVVRRYMATYPEKVLRHVDTDGIERYGISPVKLTMVDPWEAKPSDRGRNGPKITRGYGTVRRSASDSDPSLDPKHEPKEKVLKATPYPYKVRGRRKV